MHEIVEALISLLITTASTPEAVILFAGDAMQHEAQLQAAQNSSKNHIDYDYSECFTEIESAIKQADYAVVNLEVPLGGAPYSGYPMFGAPDSYAVSLKDAGFDMFLTANNHTLDRRDKGLRRTVHVLDSLGVDHIGTYRNKAARDSVLPFLKEIKGFSVGFLNYTYGTNGIKIKENTVVDYIDTALISRDIDALRANGAEIITVALHWGIEYDLLPNQKQKELANFLTDKGVDMIIGGHPHVIQPMEMRINKTGKKTFLVYSLGNFISNMKTDDTRGGAIARVKLKRDEDGVAHVDAATYSLVFTIPPGDGKKNYRLVDATERKAGSRQQNCNSFVYRARSIFDKHNINVPIEKVNHNQIGRNGERHDTPAKSGQ
ncbi:MAG: CapA family protein [Muribaculaceae bacterium]|nr:CapA family protein [Muribaculaceae bacterium]